jgi:hypothetical protein
LTDYFTAFIICAVPVGSSRLKRPVQSSRRVSPAVQNKRKTIAYPATVFFVVKEPDFDPNPMGEKR